MGLGRQRSNFAHKISRQLFNELDLFTGSQAIRFIGSAADFLSIASSLGVMVIYIEDNHFRCIVYGCRYLGVNVVEK